MIKRWLRRNTASGPQASVPDESSYPVPASLLAWAQEIDVSQLPDKTIQAAEGYLRGYQRMTLAVSQEAGWRLMAVIQARVSPPPPADAQPLDVLATVLAVRRRQLGIG